MKEGILLANLGSPDSPKVKDVRRYLAQFLMDKYVIDVPLILRWLIIYCFILPFRPKKSAEAYASIWWDEGSPLIEISKRFFSKFRKEVSVPVSLGMRYGNPSIQSSIEDLLRQEPELEKINLLPLYPHYAMSSTKTVVEETQHVLKKIRPGVKLEVFPPFYQEEWYISSLLKSIEEVKLDKRRHMLFSYHGLPVRHLIKTDPSGKWCRNQKNCCTTTCNIEPNAHETCYSHQVHMTTKKVVENLGLKQDNYTICFQSRLGRDEWIRPSTEETLISLAKKGVEDVTVICPAFVADCLETLEEIKEELKEIFIEHGGKTFEYIPCLNDKDYWVKALASQFQK